MKLSVGFINYYGIDNQTLVELACALSSKGLKVKFFWCLPGRELFSNYRHRLIDEGILDSRVASMRDAGVDVIQFDVQARFIPNPELPWIGSNFFQCFRDNPVDTIFTWRTGRREYPFLLLNVPIVEWNIFGGFDSSANIACTLHLSELTKKLSDNKSLGFERRTQIFYPPVKKPVPQTSLRRDLGISEEAFVFGFHQRVEDGIFSSIPLEAYELFIHSKSTAIDTYFVILGGSDLYKKQAAKLKLKNIIFLPYSSQWEEVSRFLQSLDIYAHGRHDGETLGRAIQEAIVHGLPIISHIAQWNAQLEYLGDAGLLAKNVLDYSLEMRKLVCSDTHLKFRYDNLKFANRIIERRSHINRLVNALIYAKEFSLRGPAKSNALYNVKCVITVPYFILRYGVIQILTGIERATGIKFTLKLQSVYAKFRI